MGVLQKRFSKPMLLPDIKIPGIVEVKRDEEYDDKGYYRSGGIRLFYKNYIGALQGVKDGILLEAGFDNVTPNSPMHISSWAYETSILKSIDTFKDNRATEIACYDHRYTFVEKLQTITSRFRQEQTDGQKRSNYMRQYYDLYCLLGMEDVNSLLGPTLTKRIRIKDFLLRIKR